MWNEIETWPPQTRKVNPYQEEIDFFWPLTQQIPLDLDYDNCERPVNWTTQTITTNSGGMSNTIVNNMPPVWTTTSFRLQENTTTMVVQKEPNFIRKFIYKLIGFKWEVN